MIQNVVKSFWATLLSAHSFTCTAPSLLGRCNNKCPEKQGRIHGRQMRPPRYLLTRAIPYRPSLITPFPAPSITSYHFPSPCSIPDGLDGRKDAFSRIQKKKGYGRMDRRTDGWTDRPSYRDARTHLKTEFVIKLLNVFIKSSTVDPSLLQSSPTVMETVKANFKFCCEQVWSR